MIQRSPAWGCAAPGCVREHNALPWWAFGRAGRGLGSRFPADRAALDAEAARLIGFPFGATALSIRRRGGVQRGRFAAAEVLGSTCAALIQAGLVGASPPHD